MILDSHKFSIKTFFNFIVGIIISYFLFYYAIKDFELSKLYGIIPQINFIFILISILLLVFTIYLRSIRWKLLINNKISLEHLYKAQFIGYFGNNILPLRLGELLRSYFISKLNKISISRVFGSVVLERVIDMLSVGFLSILLFFYSKNIIYKMNDYLYYSILFMFCISIVGTILSLLKKEKLSSYKKNKFRLILLEIYNGFIKLDKNNLFFVVIITISIWLIYILNIYLIQSAFDLNLSLVKCIIILIISTFAISIPALPGSIGTFEGAVVYSLSLFNIVDNFGFGFILHMVSYIPYTFIGLVYFLENINVMKKNNYSFKYK